MNKKGKKTLAALIAAAVIIIAALVITAVVSSGKDTPKTPKDTGSDIVTQEMLDEFMRQAEEENGD